MHGMKQTVLLFTLLFPLCVLSAAQVAKDARVMPRVAPPSSESIAVTLQGLQFAVPRPFVETKELAVAEQISAPGRFAFREGRAFYNPATAEVIQVHVSDNPMVGLNHERAQKKFLATFGGLSERSWGLDTFAGVFFPIPKESSEFGGTVLEKWMNGNPEEREGAKAFLKMGEGGVVSVALVLRDATRPGSIYLVKLTPGALALVKKKTVLWDINFQPNQALLGETGIANSAGVVQSRWLSFRARTNTLVTDSDIATFSLPKELLGKEPNFWWIMLSDKPTVFDRDSKTLYHVVLATFDDGNPPKTLDSVLNSISFPGGEPEHR